MPAVRRLHRDIAFALACLACAASAVADPCFSVEGSKITIERLFADGKPHIEEVEDMPSQSSMIARSSEARNVTIVKIRRDGAKNVTGFAATIDGKSYEYPKDRCRK